MTKSLPKLEFWLDFCKILCEMCVGEIFSDYRNRIIVANDECGVVDHVHHVIPSLLSDVFEFGTTENIKGE